MYNLLKDRIIPVEVWNGEREFCTLGGVLAALTQGRVKSFPHLRDHQIQAWHTFLVQLAVMAIDEAAGADSPKQMTSLMWDDALYSIGGWYTTWELVVDDLTKPAFLQPPHPTESSIDYEAPTKGEFEYGEDPRRTPDALSVLFTNRQHSMKAEYLRDAQPIDWVYALVTRQTLGYFSKGGGGAKCYYSISRVNSNFGNRLEMHVVPSIMWPDLFNTNVQQVLRGNQIPDRDKIRLAWTEPWRGVKGQTIPAEEVSPLFIDVANRIRLLEGEGGIVARIAATACIRVEQSGELCNPWQPTDCKKGKPASASEERRLRYDVVAPMIFGLGWNMPDCLRPVTDGRDGPQQIEIRGMPRTQGKVLGIFHRQIEVPEDVLPLLGHPDGDLAEEAEIRLDQCDTFLDEVFKPAVCYVSNPPEKEQFAARWPSDDNRQSVVKNWMNALRWKIDKCFFPRLWLSIYGGAGQHGWPIELLDLGHQVLSDCIMREPLPYGKGYWCRNRPKEILQEKFEEAFADELEERPDLDLSEIQKMGAADG